MCMYVYAYHGFTILWKTLVSGGSGESVSLEGIVGNVITSNLCLLCSLGFNSIVFSRIIDKLISSNIFIR